MVLTTYLQLNIYFIQRELKEAYRGCQFLFWIALCIKNNKNILKYLLSFDFELILLMSQIKLARYSIKQLIISLCWPPQPTPGNEGTCKYSGELSHSAGYLPDQGKIISITLKKSLHQFVVLQSFCQNPTVDFKETASLCLN